jgi:Protein of unknown function (DUF3309)
VNSRIFSKPDGELQLRATVSISSNQPCERAAMLGTILLIILILLLIGALPTWGYSGGWGYYPTGGVGLLLVIVIILLVMGRI